MSEDTETKIEERKTLIKKGVFNWLKDPLNLSLALVMLFAFSIRLYYFITINNQPLWWDEAVYGGLARNMISHMWDGTIGVVNESAIRPLFFSLLWSVLIRINIPELGARFIFEFIPSIFSVFFVYLIGKEVFNKRVGIISAFIFSVLWIHLFYTLRLMTDVPTLFFLFSSIYFFIISTKQEFNFRYFSLSLLLLSISTLIRYPSGMVFFAYLFILIAGKQLHLKKIKFWYSSIIGISPILLFFLINLIKTGNLFPALLGGSYVGAEKFVSKPFAFDLLRYIPVFLERTLFILFLVGLAIILFELVIGFNFITRDNKLRNYLLLVLILVIFYSYFIFYMRAASDRYFFPTAITLSCFAAFGIDSLYNLIKKSSKYIAVFLVLAVLIFGAYSQIKMADNLIQVKKTSYLQVRQGFEWIKENTPEDSIITGSGIYPYSMYYAERKYFELPLNESESDKILEADYVVVHGFTPQREYINKYLQENQDKWQPVNAFFFDEQKTQPILVIYKKKI